MHDDPTVVGACCACGERKPLTIAVCEDCLAILPPHAPAGDPEFMPSFDYPLRPVSTGA